MPESAKDRCTRAHEYIFMLAKSAHYYYNAKAIKEPAKEWPDEIPPTGWDTGPGPHDVCKHNSKSTKERYNRSRAKFAKTDPQSAGRRMFENTKKAREKSGLHDGHFGPTRNRRSVWTISTKPFKEAHFATFPPDLVEPMILVGCPPGGIVLDPFLGAGTTGLVAKQLGRDFIGIELNPEYCRMAEKRIAQINYQPLLEMRP